MQCEKKLCLVQMRRFQDSSFPPHVMSTRQSICISTAPTGDFITICRENPNEVDIGQQRRALCVKTSVSCNVAGENESHKTLFSNECYQAVRVAEKLQI